MRHYLTYYFVILSSLMHIFCCGIPLFLSITNLTTLLGISSLQFFEFEIYEFIEPYILVISGILLILSAIFYGISQRINCAQSNHCHHPPCDQQQMRQLFFLKIASGLFFINLLIVGIDYL